MDQKTAFRTAAVLFADDSNMISTRTIHKKIIQSLFLDIKNSELGINQLIELIKQKLDLIFDEKEIVDIVNKDKKQEFVVRHDRKNEETFLRLSDKAYSNLEGKNNQLNIENYISQYCENIYRGHLSKGDIKSAFFRFFYELLNKNISAFKKIISSKPQGEEIGIDYQNFTLEERTVINDFLNWENSEKNKAVFSLASCSIEYACISNDINLADSGLEAISKKYFYLDNNIIFRAVGLNGEFRKNRTLTFLRKSMQNGQKLFISRFTIQEFKETISYHIGLLQKVPFGKINPLLFTKYAIKPTIYEFYHQWRVGKSAYGFDLFLAHIKLLYQKFVKEFEIIEDYKIPFDETDDTAVKKIEKYTSEIGGFKGNDNSYDGSNRYDALNTYLVEERRGANNITISDTKYYFLSADIKLRNWDFSRGNMQPIALLPSQWMGIILKYFGRTDDDYKSYIQFLQISKDVSIINEDKLQIILAGISEMTEDFQKQEDILKQMLEVKFEKSIDIKKPEESREMAIEFTKSILEDELIKLQGDHSERLTEIRELAREKEGAIVVHKSELFKEYSASYRQMQVQKGNIDFEIIKGIHRFRNVFITIVVLWYLAITLLILRFGWETMEPITYLLAFGFVVVGYIYVAFQGKDVNPIEYFKRKRKKITEDVYLKYNFDEDRFRFLKDKVEEV